MRMTSGRLRVGHWQFYDRQTAWDWLAGPAEIATVTPRSSRRKLGNCEFVAVSLESSGGCFRPVIAQNKR